MDKCAPCLCTLTLPTCFDTLVVGTVGSPNTNYWVYIQDNTINKLTGYEATSGATGVISISLTSIFAENHSYSLWATLRTSTPEEREDILISGASNPTHCFDLKFQTIKNATFTSLTLKKGECCEETTDMETSCYNVCLLAKRLNVDFSSVNSFTFTYEGLRSLDTILPLYARVEWVSGDYSDTNAQLIIKDATNIYFSDLAQFDNTFLAGSRKVMYLSTTPMNYVKADSLIGQIPNASINAGCTADIYVYGIKI